MVSGIPLPGIGVRYKFVTEDGARVGVVHHRSGMRELVLFEHDDPDTSHDLVRLGPEDSRTLAELPGVSQVARDLAELERRLVCTPTPHPIVPHRQQHHPRVRRRGVNKQ
jgi:TrkA domain protein